MRKKNRILLIVGFLLVGIYTLHTFGIFKSIASGTKAVPSATWSVTRSQSQSNDSLVVIPELMEDEYTLTVTSSSEVDIKYKILISNLPTGVEVALDNGSYQTPTSGSLEINNSNQRINYSDATKTKNHTLHFRAVSGATYVNNREININVEFSQVI